MKKFKETIINENEYDLSEFQTIIKSAKKVLVPTILKEETKVQSYILKSEKGDQGERGINGKNASIKIKKVTEGTEPSVVNVGDDTNVLLEIVLPKALKGDKGENGDKGDSGNDGRNGLDGKNGIASNGKDGLDGKNGKDGIDGKDGLAGSNGIDGKDGRNGKDGKDGIGKDGLNGRTGLKGKDGKDGEKGEKGDKGEGEKGDKGEAGNDGLDGKDGINGLDGKDGKGLDGKDGKDGLNGKDGLDGAPGKDGVDGVDGEKGDMPKHEIDNTSGNIRFEVVNGIWGDWIDLRPIVESSVKRHTKNIPAGYGGGSVLDFISGNQTFGNIRYLNFDTSTLAVSMSGNVLTLGAIPSGSSLQFTFDYFNIPTDNTYSFLMSKNYVVNSETVILNGSVLTNGIDYTISHNIVTIDSGYSTKTGWNLTIKYAILPSTVTTIKTQIGKSTIG